MVALAVLVLTWLGMIVLAKRLPKGAAKDLPTEQRILDRLLGPARHDLVSRP